MKRGFTLIELMVVLAVGAVAMTMAVPIVGSAVNHYRADSALDTAVMQLRLARSMATDKRRTFSVTFTGQRTVILSQVDGNNAGDISSLDINPRVSFAFGSEATTAGEDAPGGMGADNPIDLTDGSVVHFRPDGSAVTATGEFCNGVVHMSVDHDRKVARAATVFGATGKITGWRWVQSGSEAGTWK